MTVEQMVNLLQEYSCITFRTLDDIKDENPGLIVRFGAYKFAIYMQDWDEVIKIDQVSETGTCRKELQMYQKAVEYGIEQILLKPTFCGVIKETKQEIFRQPRIDYIAGDIEHTKRERYYKKQTEKVLYSLALSRAKESVRGSRIYSEVWLAKCILHYGKAFTKSFCQWVKDTDQRDLHMGNIGYLDNKPVILDFAN